MNLPRLRRSASFGGITLASLGGTLAAGFILGNILFESLNPHMAPVSGGLISFVIVFAVLLGGGALWGAWLSAQLNAPRAALMRNGAVSFAGLVLVAGLLLEGVFGLIGMLGSAVAIPIHHMFTIVFVPAAGLIAGLCVYRITRETRATQQRFRIAWQVAVGAALAFLVVNQVMLALGWRIGAPMAAERSTMITVMLLSNAAAALAGGAVFGWILSADETE